MLAGAGWPGQINGINGQTEKVAAAPLHVPPATPPMDEKVW